MADGSTTPAPSKKLFWGCFLALITTAFGFISRMYLTETWADEFGLDGPTKGELQGMGIWPFAISIVVFSLFIDRIGYKSAMIFSFVGYVIWSIMGVSAFFVAQPGTEEALAQSYSLLYWGSLILGLSNGTVEAYINPVVATMFKENKTKWLNILHAGWPGGLVIAGLLTIGLDSLSSGDAVVPWWIKIVIIAPPAVVFFLMLIGETFPEQERVASGVSYRDMLSEFGVLGTAIASFLIVMQLQETFPKAPGMLFMIGAIVACFAMALYTRSLGNLLLFFLALIMMPLATTELGTDGWITGIMEGVFDELHPGWILIHTSAIMMVLRFFAGPIVHRLSPVGLLIGSSLLAIAGLYCLSAAQGAAMIFAAATLYAFGKTFFWPTMLGIAGEQTPRGGALTLNALGGIGMLAVGVLGFPYIGSLQEPKAIEAVLANPEIQEMVPGLVEEGKLTVTEAKEVYSIIEYEAISNEMLDAKIAAAGGDTEQIKEQIQQIRDASKQKTLADMCVFPAIMLVAYIALGLYFRSRGGYAAETIGESH